MTGPAAHIQDLLDAVAAGDMGNYPPAPSLAERIASSDLSIAPSSDLAAMIAAQKGVGEVEVLREELVQIARVVDAAVAAENAAVAAGLGNSEEVGVLRRLGPNLFGYCRDFAASHAAMAKDPNLSAAGRTEADARFAAVRTTGLDRLEAIRVDYSNRIRANFPAGIFPAPTADALPEIQLVFISAPAKTPETFAAESLAVLDRAVNATDGNAKLRASALLYHAYMPLNRRRAAKPEKFARSYAGISGALADVMAAYLDAYLHVARHAMAVDFVTTVDVQFKGIVSVALQSGADRYLLEVAGPVFDWTVRV